MTRSKTSSYPKTHLLPPKSGPTPQGLNINYNTVRKLSPKDQAILKLNLLELKEKELKKTRIGS